MIIRAVKSKANDRSLHHPNTLSCIENVSEVLPADSRVTRYRHTLSLNGVDPVTFVVSVGKPDTVTWIDIYFERRIQRLSRWKLSLIGHICVVETPACCSCKPVRAKFCLSKLIHSPPRNALSALFSCGV